MTEQSESDLYRNNEFIRHCALEKRPIFDSYKKLCEIRKNSEIDYVDFEWTYYQFYHGKQDLAIQRSPENSSPVTFSNLPIDVLEKVVQKSALDDCLALRKVSRNLRNLVDSTEMYCQEVVFQTRCSLFNSSMIRVGNTDIIYQETRDALCRIISSRNAAEHAGNRDIEKVMLADASTFIKNPKLKIGEFRFYEFNNKSYTQYAELLQSLNFRLDTRSVRIFTCESRIPPLFRFLKPGVLEKIEIDASYGKDHFDEVVETEQWKMAKRLKWSSVPPGFGMEKLLHFKEIDISPFEFTTKNLVMVRDILLKSAHFESCCLGIRHDGTSAAGDEIEMLIVRIMAQVPTFDVGTWRFSLPNTRDYFQLWILRDEDGCVVELSINKRSPD